MGTPMYIGSEDTRVWNTIKILCRGDKIGVKSNYIEMETFIRHWNVVLVGILRYTHSKIANPVILWPQNWKKCKFWEENHIKGAKNTESSIMRDLIL